MKKRLLIVMTALILALTAAGCSQKDTADNTAQKEQQADVSGAYENTDEESTASESSSEEINYSEDVDMDKVEGTEVKSESEKSETEGDLGATKVAIGDAKVIKYEDEDIFIVSFKYKNNHSTPQSFNGLFDVVATQNGSQMSHAIVVDVEGIQLLSSAENVDSGETITVQKAYKLRDTSAPVTVEIKEFNQTETSADPLVKTFDL